MAAGCETVRVPADWAHPDGLGMALRVVVLPGAGHWILANAASSSCLLAAATAFIKAGQPGRPEPWNACTRAMPREPVPLPAS